MAAAAAAAPDPLEEDFGAFGNGLSARTEMFRSPNAWPFIACIADCAADSSENETKAYPLERFWRPYFNILQRQEENFGVRGEKKISEKHACKFCPNGICLFTREDDHERRPNVISSRSLSYGRSDLSKLYPPRFFRAARNLSSPCFRRF